MILLEVFYCVPPFVWCNYSFDQVNTEKPTLYTTAFFLAFWCTENCASWLSMSFLRCLNSELLRIIYIYIYVSSNYNRKHMAQPKWKWLSGRQSKLLATFLRRFLRPFVPQPSFWVLLHAKPPELQANPVNCESCLHLKTTMILKHWCGK